MTRRFIIDTDAGSDDAVAIIMAYQWPDVEVEAITVVNGNVHLEQASVNARYIVEFCGKNTPVYDGCERPLLRPIRAAEAFHGKNGLGDIDYPHPQHPTHDDHAAGELVRRFRESLGEITLVTLGPLTNIAAALLIEPRLAEWVKECVVMGGAACTVGNVTPAAEYNIWCDPEAAQIVFQSGMKLTMVGFEMCVGEAGFDIEERQKIINLDTKFSNFVMDCTQVALQGSQARDPNSELQLPDPVTMAIALDPSVCIDSSKHNVEVSCDAELTRGMTVVDKLEVTGKPKNVNVCWAIDIPRWKEMLYQTVQ
jgi:purine nucleosidase